MPTPERSTMRGAILPGDSTAQLHDFPVPTPGHGEVLLAVRASSICGSDIRAIYREHLGHGPEGYRNVIAGHEPAGEVVEVGAGCETLRVGDRVLVYHIRGCGQCRECRKGYMIGCTRSSRAAYGWQRDGGHAEFMLADEATCIRLPAQLDFIDGALISCGFGTAYEALLKVAASGLDKVLVVGLGPVGLATAMLARAMGARHIAGVDVAPERRELAAGHDFIDRVWDARTEEPAESFTVVVECSGSAAGRALAIRSCECWGRVAFVGEGPDLAAIDVSHDIIHKQLTLHGSWVTSLGHMAELVDHLVAWRLRPSDIVTHTFSLDEVEEAYRTAAGASAGKVCIVMP